ncbi:MAG: hypothetical protein QNJ84_04085 [Alphaproteobacteria bacterium]|nr:hypothetical protein [Alphaproteobacteria bacterium]
MLRRPLRAAAAAALRCENTEYEAIAIAIFERVERAYHDRRAQSAAKARARQLLD